MSIILDKTLPSWQENKIGEILSLEYGKSLKNYREENGKYDVFGTNGKIGVTDNFLYDKPSLVIGRKGAYRGVHLAKTFFFVIDTAFYTKFLIEELCIVFLYFWFKNIDINSMDSGSAIPSTDRYEIYDLDILLPTFNEQKAIAAVLSSLDDKIDLLHRQNKTLEAMAETLFRQWFVEDVGEGWVEGKVQDLFVLQRGYDLPTQKRRDGPYPIFAASGYSGGHSEFKIRGPGVTTGRSGLLGKVFYVHDDFWPLNTSLYVKEFKYGSPLFCYHFLKTIDLMAFNAGSAVPTLNRNHVHETSVLIPPNLLIERFESIAVRLYQKIKKNELQMSTLEKLRDTLLPKLMSGEVRVRYDNLP
ncbi:MAG: restriction endonuclease subunit S [Proteobacteria bacterium]|nr:restriction endonuclease subunit S [Pseudomonadota bacterium]